MTQVTPLAQQGSTSGTPVAASVPAAGGAYSVFTATPGAIQIGATGIYVVNVSQFASYDINAYMYTQSPGVLASNIVGEITLQWFDDLTTGIPVFEEDWWIGCARSATPAFGGNLENTLSGTGPMHGLYMTVYVSTSQGATATATLKYINIFGSVRTVPYSDWRQNVQAVSPQDETFTILAGGGSSFDNVLANTQGGVTLPSNNTRWIPLGLYSGPVFYRYEASVVPAVNPVIVNLENMWSGQMADNGLAVGVLVDITAAGEQEGMFYAPRAPCAFLITGNAAGTTDFTFQAIAQQAA